MAEITTVQISHLQSYPVFISLFRDVRNAPFLRRQLLEGNTQFEYAFIDATCVFSKTHLLAAVFRAINDLQAGRLKSRNVHSEIVFSLNPNNNIAESFRKFGISDDTKMLLAVKVGQDATVTAESVRTHLSEAIEGSPEQFSDERLRSIADIAKIRKIYKLNDPPSKEKKSKNITTNGTPTALEISETDDGIELEVFILGIMALKGS